MDRGQETECSSGGRKSGESQSSPAAALTPLTPRPTIAVRMVPFAHQAGGHATMLSLDGNTVCKPRRDREAAFYKSVGGAITSLTAEYKGSVEVEQLPIGDGKYIYVGYFSQETLKRVSPSVWKLVEKNAANSSQACDCIPCSGQASSILCPLEESTEHHDRHAANNVNLVKLFRTSENGKLRFVLLENIVSRFKRPCVIDIKMGTRQHGDEESSSKTKRKTHRCAITTSAKIGIRIAGMQVYQTETDEYLVKDKYWGRALDTEGVRRCLITYLTSGDRLRYEFIRPLITRLTAIHAVLSEYDTYRFYSGSLLLSYDGGYSPAATDCLSAQREEGHAGESGVGRWCNVHMCDFEHTTYESFRDDRVVHRGPDAGYMLGVKSLIDILEGIGKSCTPASVNDSQSP